VFSCRAGRIEAACSHLQVAAETILHSLVEDLKKQKDGIAIMQIVMQNRQGRDSRGTFNLLDYKNVLQDPQLPQHLRRLEELREDVKFLTEELPQALGELRKLRNQAEHEPNKQLTQSEVVKIFKKFVGIGSHGILRRLLRIRRKLGAVSSGQDLSLFPRPRKMLPEQEATQ
jgi:hypothetical protein